MKIKEHVVGFSTVSMALGVMLLTTAVILTSYRGTCDYLKEFREFRGALSRTMGGDYNKTRNEFIESEETIPELSAAEMVKKMSDEQKEQVATALIEDGFSVPRNVK